MTNLKDAVKLLSVTKYLCASVTILELSTQSLCTFRTALKFLCLTPCDDDANNSLPTIGEIKVIWRSFSSEKTFVYTHFYESAPNTRSNKCKSSPAFAECIFYNSSICWKSTFIAQSLQIKFGSIFKTKAKPQVNIIRSDKIEVSKWIKCTLFWQNIIIKLIQ